MISSKAPFRVGLKRQMNVILLLALILAWGCAKSPSPETVAGPDFPEERYLKARGEGKTLMDARKQAMAELSAIFESRVFSQFTSFARSSLAADQAEVFEKDVESKIRIASDVRLQGARIGKTWQDESSGLFHALAVLDRADAGRTWTSRMEAMDNEIQADADALKTMEGRLSRMVALNRIMGRILDRQVLESRLRVIDYPVEDISMTGVDPAAVMREQALLKSGLRIHILVQGEYGGRVRDIIAQGLSQKGITLVHDPGAANAQVLGKAEVSLMSLKNVTTRFVRAQGSVQVFESPDQALFVQINENIRKGHSDENEARHRAVESLADLLTTRLLTALGYGEN